MDDPEAICNHAYRDWVALHHLKSFTFYKPQYFRGPMWCKISSINSVCIWVDSSFGASLSGIRGKGEHGQIKTARCTWSGMLFSKEILKRPGLFDCMFLDEPRRAAVSV